MKKKLHHLIKGCELFTPGDLIDLDALGVPDPRYIVSELDRYIIGQDSAKRALALMLMNRALVFLQAHGRLDSTVLVDKSNVLMLGPTGTGKTALIQALEEVYEVPILIFDVTCLTTNGYYGMDVNEVLNQYINKYLMYAQSKVTFIASECGIIETETLTPEILANSLLETGIIYLDEIDKLHDQRTGHGLSLQQELLTYLEGSNVSLRVKSGDKQNNGLGLETLNTKNISFIAGGSFEGLQDIITTRMHAGSSIGFTGNVNHKIKNSKESEHILENVTEDDLIKYGFLPEFIGRFSQKSVLHRHTKESLHKIIFDSENSIYKQYDSVFSIFKSKVICNQEAIDLICEKVIDMKLGARGLKNMFYKVFEEHLFNAFDLAGKELIITKEMVERVNGK